MKFTNKDLHSDGRPLTKEEFINKIKTDDEFAKKWGDLGPVYGKQWRSWRHHYPKTYPEINQYEQYIGVKTIDQIANLINDLKTNPDSRRLMVNAWNVGELDSMVLPPCHYGFQVYTRELSLEERVSILGDIQTNDNGYYEHSYAKLKCDEHNVPKRAISLMWNQRSCDVPLGIPFNIASYGLLLEIIAKEVNMVPDELIGNLGDCHIYSNQIDGVIEQIGRELTLEERYDIHKDYITSDKLDLVFELATDENLDKLGVPTRTREPFPLPKLVINDEFWNPDADFLSNLPHIEVSDFYVENYQSHPTIKAPLSN